jgi:hypothetical protein
MAEFTPRSANTGLKIRAWSLAIEWNPASAILHRENACLKHRLFLTRNFTSVKRIHGAMFRHKLYIRCLNWHTILLYYTLNIRQGFSILERKGTRFCTDLLPLLCSRKCWWHLRPKENDSLYIFTDLYSTLSSYTYYCISRWKYCDLRPDFWSL